MSFRPGKVKHLEEPLYEQFEQAEYILRNDLLCYGSILKIIPEKYHFSDLLYMMHEYLVDGEVDSWEGCIKTFKDDFHKICESEHWRK